MQKHLEVLKGNQRILKCAIHPLCPIFTCFTQYRSCRCLSNFYGFRTQNWRTVNLRARFSNVPIICHQNCTCSLRDRMLVCKYVHIHNVAKSVGQLQRCLLRDNGLPIHLTMELQFGVHDSQQVVRCFDIQKLVAREQYFSHF